jgi:hypothetical protein
LVYYQLCRPHQFCCDRSLGAVMCCCLSSCITPIDFPAGDERHNYMDFLARAQNTGNTTPSCFAVSTDTQYTRQQESVSQLDTQQAREYCRGWMSLYGKYVFVRSAAANTQALSHWIIIVPWNHRLRVRQPHLCLLCCAMRLGVVGRMVCAQQGSSGCRVGAMHNRGRDTSCRAL